MEERRGSIMAYDVEVPLTNEQHIQIEKLLHTSTLDQRQTEWIENRMFFLDEVTAQEIIDMLTANQQMTDKEIYRQFRV